MIRMMQVRPATTIAALATALMLNAPAFADSIFPDENLEAAVRQQVHDKRHTDEPLTAEDVQNVATVDASGREITNLAGMEHLRSLAALDLSDNAVSDLSPLADLDRLQTLDLANNEIADVSPLANLTRLQRLELSGNDVVDIEPLNGMTNMRSLYLSDNAVEDPAPLRAMERLWSLYLDGNPVQQWEALASLQRLNTLDVSRTGLGDLEPLTEVIPSLSLLLAEENEIEDVSPLVQVVQEDAEGSREFAPFLRVYLRGNPLSDEAREQLEQLREHGTRVTFQDEDD